MRSNDLLPSLPGILRAQTVRRTHKLQESHLDAINDAHGGISMHKDVFLYFTPLFSILHTFPRKRLKRHSSMIERDGIPSRLLTIYYML